MRIVLPLKHAILYFLQQQGALRILLAIFAVVLIWFMPNSSTPMLYQGWAILTTVLPIVLAPLVIMVLLFDALMSRVLMSDTVLKEQKRHQLIIISNLTLSILVLTAWLPYFLSLA